MLPPTAAAPPPVLQWYRIYAGAMAVLYYACVVGGVLITIFHEEIATTEPADEPWLWLVYGVAFIGVGLFLAIAYTAAFFVPRQPWAWVYHLVLISIGLTSCCCMPISIPLLIHWFKPATQTWFGR